MIIVAEVISIVLVSGCLGYVFGRAHGRGDVWREINRRNEETRKRYAEAGMKIRGVL